MSKEFSSLSLDIANYLFCTYSSACVRHFKQQKCPFSWTLSLPSPHVLLNVYTGDAPEADTKKSRHRHAQWPFYNFYLRHTSTASDCDTVGIASRSLTVLWYSGEPTTWLLYLEGLPDRLSWLQNQGPFRQRWWFSRVQRVVCHFLYKLHRYVNMQPLKKIKFSRVKDDT